MGQIIQIDGLASAFILGEMVRGTSKRRSTPKLIGCAALGHYERSEARQNNRAGSYERTLHTKSGYTTLKVPRLRPQTFETVIMER
jgi:putative transposase